MPELYIGARFSKIIDTFYNSTYEECIISDIMLNDGIRINFKLKFKSRLFTRFPNACVVFGPSLISRFIFIP